MFSEPLMLGMQKSANAKMLMMRLIRSQFVRFAMERIISRVGSVLSKMPLCEVGY